MLLDPMKGVLSLDADFDSLFERYSIALESGHPSKRSRLLSISPPRSMTSFLFTALKECEGLFIPPNKETNFFWSEWNRPPSSMDAPVNDSSLTVVDISPSYAALPLRAIERIHASYPDTQLLLMIRDPEPRAVSHLIFELTRPHGTGFRLDELNHWPTELWQCVLASFARLYSPARILTRWLTYYPPEQINICFCSGLIEGNADDLKAIRNFVRTPKFDVNAGNVVAALDYTGLFIPADVWSFLRSLFRRDRENLEAMVARLWGRAVPYAPVPLKDSASSFVVYRSKQTGRRVLFENDSFTAIGSDETIHWTGPEPYPAIASAMGCTSNAPQTEERLLEIHFALANNEVSLLNPDSTGFET